MSNPNNHGDADLPDPFGGFGKHISLVLGGNGSLKSPEPVETNAEVKGVAKTEGGSKVTVEPQVDVVADITVTTEITDETVTPARTDVSAETESMASIIRRARKSPEEVAALVSVKKEHVAISIIKPPTKGKYWRVRDGKEWSYHENTFMMLQPEFGGDQKDFLLVRPDLEGFVQSKPQLRAMMRTFGLAFMVDIHGGPAYWALNLGDPGNWGTSARVISDELKADWGTVCPESGRYVLVRPEDDLGDPIWPEGSPDEWLEKAFKDRVIDSENHPAMKSLLGRTS